MKKHAIIPIFIAHRGCPNDCVFCNQKKITAREGDITPEEVPAVVDTWLTTLSEVETVELAFYGGSFTGLPISEQTAFLKVASEYKEKGLIDGIHLSTRPDYINREILDNLKAYGVDVIELGVQSLDSEVLAAAGRGHTVEAVYDAAALIKEYGFALGIQLMIGLPGDTREKAMASAIKTVEIGPDIARLYPTVVLEDTRLADMYQRGEYLPPTQDEMVEITAAMYRILSGAGINIIRVGLKATDIISEDGVLGNSFHPAFRQLVEGHIAREDLEKQLEEKLSGFAGPGTFVRGGGCCQSFMKARDGRLFIDFLCNPKDISNMIGNGGENRKYFEKKYKEYNIRWLQDESLGRGGYVVRLSEEPGKCGCR